MQKDLTYRQRQKLFAKHQQVKTGQNGGQVGVRVNRRRPCGNGKETVDHSSVGQISASAREKTVRGRGVDRGQGGQGRGRSFPEIGADLFGKIPYVNKNLN